MSPSSAYLLPAIRAISWIVFLGLWVLVSVGDIKTKKILHRHLNWGLMVAAVSYALMLASTFLGHRGALAVYYNWDFYQDLLVYIGTSTLVSLGLWQIRIWPAGDAKLYAFLSVIFPMLSISGSFHAGWLFLDVLVNIFVPACVAVFAEAAHYIWLTRIQHARSFIAQMGLRRELGYWIERFREYAVSSGAEVRAALAAAAASPGPTALAVVRRAGQWVFSIFVMALISCAIKDVIPMPFLRTLVCFALVLSWKRLGTHVGARWSGLLAAGLFAALMSRGHPAEFMRELTRSFTYLTLFGVFMGMGMQMSVGMMRGQLIMFAIPLLTAALGMLTWPSWPAGGAGRTLLALSLMGLFFGVSFIFVRIWDDEDHPNIPLERVLSYMVLHRSFHQRLSEDVEFYETHFQSSYADGLTASQAEALRAWCAERGIETVPMTTTMSFAHWIFLGYFVTWALGGSLLQMLL